MDSALTWLRTQSSEEGAAIDDFMKPDRIVVGVTRAGPKHWTSSPSVYFERSPVIFMDIPSAEMTNSGERYVGDEDFLHERHCQPV